jgi:hypothetical protein
MSSVMKKLTASQAANVVRLIVALRKRAEGGNDTMKAGLTDREGLVAFYGPNLGHTVTFSEPYGHAPVMLFSGQMVTANNVNRIASSFNSAFGPAFYNEVMENGQSVNVTVSILNDVIPHLEAYQSRHDRELPIRKLKAAREQVRTMMRIADNPASPEVAKNIPAATAARWRALDKHLTAEIAKLESFD